MRSALTRSYQKRITRSFVPQIAEESLQTKSFSKSITNLKVKKIVNVFVTLKIATLFFLGIIKKIFAKGVRLKDT